MTDRLPPLRLTGAHVLRDGELQLRSLAIADGKITRGPLPSVDLSGYLVLPGIIDLHGDAFERHVAPRPTAPFDFEIGLTSTDRDCAANGITTAWLAQSWSWEGGHRAPDYAEQFLQALDSYRTRSLTDLRVQIRCETYLIDTADRMLAAIRRHGVDYVVFNNHLDEALEQLDLNPQKIGHWANGVGRTFEDYAANMRATKRRASEVPRHLCRLAEAFDTLGIVYGSHDDCDGETREAYSMIGAKICEFPTARAAASLAKAVGDPVLMGAPNVVRGGSQSGNISALDLIRDKRCDALVSDYYYPALARAAFLLVDRGVMALPQAWAMISEKPAEILRLWDRGRIDEGKRADLVVINAKTRAIEATISDGRLTHLCGGAAARFLQVQNGVQIAAE